MNDAGAASSLPDAIAKAENLPSPPTVAVEVLRVTNDEAATIDDLVAVLSRDPALSAKLMKLANSSMFRRGEEVSSLDKATLRIGFKTVKLMSLSFSLTNDLPRKGETIGFDYRGYWSRSLTMGVAGRSFSRMVKSPHGDEAFLCGLLSRLGQIVMAQCIPSDYAAIIERAEGRLPEAAQEREALGTDLHEVGASVLRSWRLPELVWRAVLHWGAPTQVPDDIDAAAQRLSQILHLADHATRVLYDERGAALKKLYDLGAEFCGLSEAELDACIVSLEHDVSELAAMLNVDVDRSSYQEILDRARMEMVQISLGTQIELQRRDSLAIELEAKNRELESRANTDALTGIPNRARFDATLEEVIRARLAGESENALGILLIDVDRFKAFNDTHGHPTGDEVLKRVARSLKDATRDTDLAARYGGEEFVIIVPNTTLPDLERVAERVRARIEATRLDLDGRTLSVTASVGGACLGRVRSEGDGKRLVTLADACLYEAKNAGRNRCVCKAIETT